MSEIRIKGNTQIRPATITQDRHKPYLGHTMEVRHQYVVGTHAHDGGDPLASPRYGEIVLATGTGTSTWNGDSVTGGNWYQWQATGWEMVGALDDGDRAVAGFGGGTLMNNLIGDFVGHENELAIWDDGNSDWIWVEPDDGESWLCYVRGDGFWNQMTFMWAYVDSLSIWAWTPLTRWMDKSAGDGLQYEGPGGMLSTTDPDDPKLAIELETDEVGLVVDANGLYHNENLSHAIRVDISNLSNDQNLQPVGGESAGHVEQVKLSGIPAGLWSAFSNGDIVEYDGQSWSVILPYANLASGMRARLSDSVSGSATFAGMDNEITEWNGSSWNLGDGDDNPFVPNDGALCVQQGSQTSGSSYENDLYVWDAIADSWVNVAQSVAVSGNALQENSGVISHVDEAGHSFEAVDYGNIYSDDRQSGSDPVASAHTGETWICNNWGTKTDGEVVYSDGNAWQQISGATAGNLINTGKRFISASSVDGGAGFAAKKIIEVTAIDWVNGNTYTEVTPHAGDRVFVKAPPAGGNEDITAYERATLVWDDDDDDWVAASKFTTSLDGSGLESDSISRLQVRIKSDAGLAFDSSSPSYLTVIGQSSSGYPNEPTGSDPVVLLSYLEAVMQGRHWKDPAVVLKMISDADQSGSDPANPQTGDAYVVNNWATQTDGDIVEWSGSAWVVIVDEGGAGEPPNGTRVVVTTGTAAGAFAGEEGKIGTYDASGDSWSFYDPEDGDALMINGESSVYENTQWVCDTDGGTTISWIQIGAVVSYGAGTGLDLSGSTFSIDTDKASGVPSSGTTWSSGVTGLDPDNMICALNGIIMEYESVIGNLEAGEFHYDPSDGDVTVSSADSFDGTNDFISIWGFKS